MAQKADTIMRLSKMISIVAVGALAAMALAGCTPGGGTSTTSNSVGGGDGKLTIWSSFGGAQGDAITAYADEFAKSHPKAKIDLVTLATADLKQKVQAGVVSGSLPDVIQYYGGSLMQPLIDAKALHPLNDYISGDEKWNADLVKGWDKNYTVDGSTYGVPVESPTVQLFFNESLLKQAGVNSAPKTFDELLTAVTKLKTAGIIPISADGKSGWPMQEFLAYLVMRNGGASALDDAFSGKLAWDSDVFMNSARQLKQLADAGAFQDGYLGEGYDQLLAHYINGEAGMTLTGSWFVGNLTAAGGTILENTSFTPFPTVTGGTGTTSEVQGGPNASFSITNNAEDPKLAWDFVRGLTSNAEATKVVTAANVVVPNLLTLSSSDTPKILNKLITAQSDYTDYTLFWDLIFTPEQNTKITDLQNAMLAASITPEEMMTQFAAFMKTQQ